MATHAVMAELRAIDMQTTVFYESWQMDCCGEPFSVGECVEWSCSKRDTAFFQADYAYEAHLPSDWLIKGTIAEIYGVTTTCRQRKNALHAVSDSRKPIRTAKRFMAEAETGFLVVLTDVEIEAIPR